MIYKITMVIAALLSLTVQAGKCPYGYASSDTETKTISPK